MMNHFQLTGYSGQVTAGFNAAQLSTVSCLLSTKATGRSA